MYLYREYSSRGLTNKAQAQAIIDSSPFEEMVTITWADPKSYWVAHNRDGVVYTAAQEYAELGVILYEADNNRIGKRKIDGLLADMPDGKPGLMIFSNCVETRRTLPKLAKSEKNPEDVAEEGQEDHWYDMLRYGLTNVTIFTGSQETRNENIVDDNPWNRLKSI